MGIGFFDGDDLVKNLLSVSTNCRKCGARFSSEEGIKGAQARGIKKSDVIVCPQCFRIYKMRLVPGSLTLLENITWKKTKWAFLGIGGLAAIIILFILLWDWDLLGNRWKGYLDNGIKYMNQGQYHEALNQFNIALKFCTKSNNKKRIRITQTEIGQVFFEQRKYPEALDYFEKALMSIRQIGDRPEKTGSEVDPEPVWDYFWDYFGEDKILNKIGEIYQAQGKYPEALDCYEKAMHPGPGVVFWGETPGYILNNIGEIYQTQGKYPKALDYYEKALEKIIDNELEIKIKENLKELKKRMK
jgi:tetratricopeptide (TPR) repeat protein